MSKLGPELYPSAPLAAHSERPDSRSINRPPTGGWESVALTEWELVSASWTDTHVHDEFNYVLEGELTVECDGAEVVASPGDVVRVPAGSTGRYSATGRARMLAIYGPNPDGEPATDLAYNRLPGA